ncbi:futalosine hydrolase [Paenibacillus dakarensis]|uniref:futalosine hydrolase n=1 Tax=Paenibacillus dakarensis TaxID=1527293 RepID=UPI0006D5A587|nr:futalosine hydrolase [Paenibacillus dakarensis]
MNDSSPKILVVTAVDAEKEAVLRGLAGNDQYDVIAGGVGPAASASRTAMALASGHYKYVISAGIGGGFPGRAPVGSVVTASAIIAADLGSETPDGFLSVDELGFGSSHIHPLSELSELLTVRLQAAGLQAVLAPILSVSTTTGTRESAEALISRSPEAAAEGMEGFGVAQAAQDFGLPVLEIRAISNLVGPRDRDAWNIPEALRVLEAVSSTLPEVLT